MTIERWATRLRRGPWPWRKKKLGARVSEPTIQKVLREAGFYPTGGHPLNLDK